MRAEEQLPPQSNHPLKTCGFFFSFCQFPSCVRKFCFIGGEFPIWVTMRQELWKLCPCKFLIMGVKRATSMAKRLQASFSYSFNLSFVRNWRLSSIIDFLFNRSSRTTHSLIPEGLRICRRIQCWKLGCILTFALKFYSRAFRYLHNSVSRWLLILSKSCGKSSLSNYKWPEFSYSLRYVGDPFARVRP